MLELFPILTNHKIDANYNCYLLEKISFTPEFLKHLPKNLVYI